MFFGKKIKLVQHIALLLSYKIFSEIKRTITLHNTHLLTFFIK